MKKTDYNKDAFRFSRFCHIIPPEKAGGSYTLFHALSMEVVFLEETFSGIIEDYKYGKSIKMIAGQTNISEEDRKNLIRLLKKLVDFGMMVSVEYDEANDIRNCKANNLPGTAINLLYLILTDECNFACKYCFVENGMPENYQFSHMSPAMAKKRIDLFADWSRNKKSKNKSILFYGGEPLMNQKTFKEAVLHIVKLVKEGRLPRNTDISMITNGSLITREIAEFIKANGVGVGLSVDGMPETNNQCRIYKSGGGTFQATWNGYSRLMEAGVDNVGISFTVGWHNVDNLLENTKYVIDKFKVKSLGYNILMDSEYQIFADREYAQKASDEIIRCFEYLREQGIYEDRMMRKVEFFTNKKVYPNDCAACGRQVVALPGGEVGPCQAFMGSKKYFTKCKTNFSPYTDKTFTEWASRSPLSMPQCYDCIAVGLCGGGCPCRSDIRNGSIWAIDDIFCIHSKKSVEWVLKDFIRQNQQ